MTAAWPSTATWWVLRSVSAAGRPATSPGRPVVVQDTGSGSVIPTGQGVLIFRLREDSAGALREVDGDIRRHAQGAREVAAEHFDSARVLPRPPGEGP